MMQKSNIEKTAHLVVGSIDPDKETIFHHVQDYQQACRFVDEQPLEHSVTLNWQYLNTQLPRRLSISFARRAVRLCDDFLEIPRFAAYAVEPMLPSHEVVMGSFCLDAASVRNPEGLYLRYTALRNRIIDQDSVGFGSLYQITQ